MDAIQSVFVVVLSCAPFALMGMMVLFDLMDRRADHSRNN